jgi:hypothetical protein
MMLTFPILTAVAMMLTFPIFTAVATMLTFPILTAVAMTLTFPILAATMLTTFPILATVATILTPFTIATIVMSRCAQHRARHDNRCGGGQSNDCIAHGAYSCCCWRSPSLTKETQQFRSRCRVRRSVSEAEGRAGWHGTFSSSADRSLTRASAYRVLEAGDQDFAPNIGKQHYIL